MKLIKYTPKNQTILAIQYDGTEKMAVEISRYTNGVAYPISDPHNKHCGLACPMDDEYATYGIARSGDYLIIEKDGICMESQEYFEKINKLKPIPNVRRKD